MSLTKTWVSQISSEIFNGSGSKDLQQDHSKILRNGGGRGGWGVVVFLPHLAFSIKITIGLYLFMSSVKIACLDRKMGVEEQGHQGSTN